MCQSCVRTATKTTFFYREADWPAPPVIKPLPPLSPELQSLLDWSNSQEYQDLLERIRNRVSVPSAYLQ